MGESGNLDEVGASRARLHAWNTVRAAYAAVFDNAGALAGLVVLWVGFWIAYSLASPTLATLVKEAFPLVSLEGIQRSLQVFGHLVVQGIGVVLACIAWHRFIILEERLRKPFPDDVGIAVQYTRRAILIMLPPAVLVGSAIWMTFNLSIEIVPATVVVQLTESIAIAALARAQLAFPAAAIGEREPTFRGSWALTSGSTLPLFAGILACDLPLTIVSIAIDEATIEAEAETLEGYAVTAVLIVFEFMRATLVAAFLSYAYLHFTKADAANRPPASYFS